MGIWNTLATLFADAANNNLGLIAIAAAIAIFSSGMSSLGESWICCHAIDGMARNPENQKKLQSTMILAVALDESCGIYALVIAILILFVFGGKA